MPNDETNPALPLDADHIVDAVREPLLVLGPDLRVLRANRSFYRAFGVSPHETQGTVLYELGNGQWDIPDLRRLLEEVLPQNSSFDDFEVTHDFPCIGRKVMLLNARRVHRDGNRTDAILLAIEDITMRRRLEDERREIETRFTSVVKNVRDHSIFTLDPQGLITSWNVEAERILGFGEAEVLGRHFSIIFTDEDRRAGVPDHETSAALAEGRAEDERWHVRKGGERFWALGIVTPTHDAAGRHTGFSKILRDMTDRKRAEEAAREREQRFRTLIQNIPDYAIFMLDPGGVVVEWTEGAQRVKGYTAEEALGQHLSLFFTPEDIAAGAVERELAEAAEHGRAEREQWRVRKGGERFWVNEVATAIRDGGGNLVGFTKISRDLTDRKRMQDALRESEERFRLLVENVRDYAIFTTDAQGRVTTWNPGARNVFGYDAEEVVGRNAGVLFTPEDRAGGEHEKELATAAREGRASDDRWQVRKDGVRFWASGVTTPLHADGRLSGFTKICRDDSARKQFEEQLRSANDVLERRVGERTASLTDYQRQLRSLVGELGRTEVRERRRLASDLHDNLAQLLAVCKMRVSSIQSSARAGTRVAKEAEAVKEFLGEGIAYTRTLMADLRPEAFNEHDLAAAVEWAARRMERHGLTVRVEDDGLPKPLDEDTLGLLFQSVRELLFNVLKHAGRKDAAVRLERLDGEVRVTVSDDGGGFDATRASGPSEDGGFGLFSIRERLDLLGGRMEVESAAGRGTRVTLVARPQVKQEQIDQGETVEGNHGIPDSQKVRVLLVDDHRVVREGLKGLIDGQPDMAVVGEAADGQAAVEQALSLRPDVVVMDVNMPRVSGVEATRLIADKVPQVRVVGLSVRDDEEVAAAMREAGAHSHVAKGGEAEALFAAIRNAATARYHAPLRES